MVLNLWAASMMVLGFHLWHGFASTFQTSGSQPPEVQPADPACWRRAFAIIVPVLFAIIPIISVPDDSSLIN